MNTAVGANCLTSLSTGGYCVAVGRLANNSLTTGTQNVTIGYAAAQNATTAQNCVTLGYNSSPSSNTASHEVTLGNSSTNNLRCADTSISSLSDRRDKTDIIDLPVGLDFVNSLLPRQFKWQTREGVPNKDGKVRAGFIAQELQEAQVGSEYLDLVMDNNPEKLEAKQGKLIPVLVKAIQELSEKNSVLEAKVAALEAA